MAATALAWDFQPRRGKARLRLGIAAELVTIHGRCRVTLLDLSESGARLQHEAEQIGDCVLKWLGYEAFGSVVRRDGQEIGLHFDPPLNRAWLLDTREWLSAIAQGEDELRRFAKEWATGEDRLIIPARPSGKRAEVLQHPRALTTRPPVPESPSADRSWLRAAKPFMIAGVVAGIVAGCWSSFF
jgi:hypothetical protein